MTAEIDAAAVAAIAKGLSASWREALLAIEGGAYKSWPERRLASMLDGLGRYGLRDMRAAGLLSKNGTKHVLTPLGLAVRAHLTEGARRG